MTATMTLAAWWTVVFAGAGTFFLSMGTLGLLRLDDLHSRIHALTKADTLGLGLIVLALLPHADSVASGAKMMLVWALALVSAATIAHLLARGAQPRGLVSSDAQAEAATGTDPPSSAGPGTEQVAEEDR